MIGNHKIITKIADTDALNCFDTSKDTSLYFFSKFDKRILWSRKLGNVKKSRQRNNAEYIQKSDWVLM